MMDIKEEIELLEKGWHKLSEKEKKEYSSRKDYTIKKLSNDFDSEIIEKVWKEEDEDTKS